jgi:hypothetical protein
MLRAMQSREDSFLEALVDVVLGFVLALVTQAAVYPMFGIATTIITDSTIAVIFTGISLLRSYLVRRAFETFGFRIGPSGDTSRCAAVSLNRPISSWWRAR